MQGNCYELDLIPRGGQLISRTGKKPQSNTVRGLESEQSAQGCCLTSVVPSPVCPGRHQPGSPKSSQYCLLPTLQGFDELLHPFPPVSDAVALLWSVALQAVCCGFFWLQEDLAWLSDTPTTHSGEK